jgi:hypothetical protein
MVGSQQLKCLLEIEGNRLTQHKSKKIGPSQREVGINHVLELFIRKIEIQKYFERWLFLSTTSNGVLAIVHTKQVRAVPNYYKRHLYALL